MKYKIYSLKKNSVVLAVCITALCSVYAGNCASVGCSETYNDTSSHIMTFTTCGSTGSLTVNGVTVSGGGPACTAPSVNLFFSFLDITKTYISKTVFSVLGNSLIEKVFAQN